MSRQLKKRICQCEWCQEHPYSKVAKEHQAINRVLSSLDEKNRRRFVGLLALGLGHGGIQAVHEITGLSRTTIRSGPEEIRRVDRVDGVRQPGGGRITAEKRIQGFLMQ